MGHVCLQPGLASQGQLADRIVQDFKDRCLSDSPLGGLPPLVGALHGLVLVAEGVVDSDQLALLGEVDAVSQPEVGELVFIAHKIIKSEGGVPALQLIEFLFLLLLVLDCVFDRLEHVVGPGDAVVDQTHGGSYHPLLFVEVAQEMLLLAVFLDGENLFGLEVLVFIVLD